MKVSSKFILAGTVAFAAAGIIFGAVQINSALNQLAAPVKHGVSLASPTPAPTVTTPDASPSPASPADASARAESESGLTLERYAALKTEATAAVTVPAGTSGRTVAAAFDALAAKYGKPVVVVVEYTCAGGGMGWGITGALYGSSAGACGTGDSASEAAIMAEMDRRAGVEGWTPAEYILIITSTV